MSRRRIVRGSVAFTVFIASMGLQVLIPNAARGAAPVLENNVAGRAFETIATEDDPGLLRVTAVVRHDLGDFVTGLAFDVNYDGSDNTGTVGATAVALQQPTGGFNYSRVSHSLTLPKPGGLGGTTRRVSVPVRFAAVLNDGQRTGSVSQNVAFSEDAQFAGVGDFPVIESTSQSATSINTGSSVTFTFSGDDADTDFFSSDDEFDRYRWRVRRLNDGAITQGPSSNVIGCGDNCNNNLAVSFPQRGRFVVEAILGNENGSFPASGDWFRLGAVDVNTAATTSPVLSLTGPAGVVQQGSTATINATAVDTEAFQGRIQMIEWDADGVSGFERRELPSTEAAGLTGAQLQHSLNTTGLSGTRTITARVTDNGAMNGADTIRRTDQATFDVVINRPPSAVNQTVNTNEDTNANFTLNASDPDGDTLTYTVTDPPDNGDLSGTAPSQTYDPDPNYNGPDSFTYTVTDGRGGSDSATVSISVAPVNDGPVAADQSIVTDEDSAFAGTLGATDVDHTSLDFTVTDGPAKGDVTLGTAGAFTYTPDGDANGSDAFTFEVCDPDGACDEGVVSVTINALNDPPVPVDQDVTTDEDTTLAITLDADDVDGDTLIFGVATPPVNGTLSGVAPNLTYTPDDDFFGSDTFTFSVSDGATTVTGTVDITVNAVNDAPVAQAQAIVTDEDVAYTGALVATDVDDDPAGLTFSAGDAPTQGTVDVAADGSFTYTPDADANGVDAFTFVVCDPDGACDEATVDVTINAVNDPPVPADQDLVTDEDTPLPITLTATDADGDALTFAVATGPSSGTLAGVAPNLQYTPNPNFNGPDSLTFTVSDGESETSATVNITVNAVNDAPVGEAQAVVTDEDTPYDGALLAADVDDTVGDLTFALADAPAEGTAVVSADGAYTYTPAANFHGTDGFTFEVCDPDGACDEAQVDITVLAVNDAPTADDDDVSTDEDETLTIDLSAADVDGDDLTYAMSEPEHGEVVGAGPQVAYTPDPNYAGADAFTFTVSDGHGGTALATIDIDVVARNDAPDAIPQLVSTAEDTPLALTLTAEDVDGDDVTIAVTEEPSHGSVTGTGPDVVYTPEADFTGNDFFTFEACDPAGACDEAIVSIHVTDLGKAVTRLVAEPSVIRLDADGLFFWLNLRATLTTADGQPVEGARVLFDFPGDGEVCDALTDDDGVASCGGHEAVINSALHLGYRASYAGDADHEPSSDNGPLVKLGGLRLLR